MLSQQETLTMLLEMVVRRTPADSTVLGETETWN